MKYCCPSCGQPYLAIIGTEDGSFALQRYSIYATTGEDNYKVAVISGVCKNCYFKNNVKNQKTEEECTKMRDIKRIEPFLREIQKIWEQVPDWRFFQLICNIQRAIGTDGFYTEDEDVLKLIKENFYITNH